MDHFLSSSTPLSKTFVVLEESKTEEEDRYVVPLPDTCQVRGTDQRGKSANHDRVVSKTKDPSRHLSSVWYKGHTEQPKIYCPHRAPSLLSSSHRLRVVLPKRRVNREDKVD